MKKVSVVGLGYIGLPTAIVSAQHNLQVSGFDIDREKIDAINVGDPVIVEPGLSSRLKSVIDAQTFVATAQLQPADYFVIAVPTPFKEEKKADLSYVFAAAESIARVLKKNDTVILESTIPVGTTDFFADFLEKKTGFRAGVDFFVAHCPERVLPGRIFIELVENPRIIGGINKASVKKASEFYKYFVKGSLYLTNATTAEMVKLIENSCRDIQIAFAQQVASMAEKKDLNPFEVIELANKHPRVDILHPSCGVGGHCIAVDPWFLIETFPENTTLLQSARTINDEKPLYVSEKVKKFAAEWHSKKGNKCNVLALGLTYKPDVDDLRESPALAIATELRKNSAINLQVCDPHISIEKQIELDFEAVSLHEGLENADVVLCLVPHNYFRKIDKDVLAQKKIFDTCGLFYTPRSSDNGQEKEFWPKQNINIRTEKPLEGGGR